MTADRDEKCRRATTTMSDVTVDDLLARLEPLQEPVVSLVYFGGRSQDEAARILAVERVGVAAAMAVAFRKIARWVIDEDMQMTSFPSTSRARHRRDADWT